MDIFLVVTTCIILVVLGVVGVYLLVHFSHPDDKNEAYLPKAVVLFGFVLASAMVLLLPLDVVNKEGYAGCDGYDTKLCGGMNMSLFWDIMYILVLVWLIVLIPFSTFYYEADDGLLLPSNAKPNNRAIEAIKWQLAVLIVSALVFCLTYFFLNESSIPVREYIGPKLDTAVQYYVVPEIDSNGTYVPFSSNQFTNITQLDVPTSVKTVRSPQLNTIAIDVSPMTFVTALLAFLGWILFSVFGGIGMAALPLDLILNFTHRPRHMGPVEMADASNSIKKRVNELVDIGEMIKIERAEHGGEGETKKGFLCFGGGGGSRLSRKERKEQTKTLREFKQAVFLLERDVEDFKACTTSYNEYNPLWPYASLFFGILSFVLSIFWVLQICLYVIPNPPIHPLLNDYFRWFDGWFPLFGTLSVAAFSFYLLICALKGCFKFGLRFFFFTIHPMVPNKTYMSSFLFNIALILLCSIPVVQFSTEAFADYARNTTAYQVYGTQIRYMKFFSFFFKNYVFVYVFLGFFSITCIYLAVKPRDKATDATILRDRLKAMKS